MQGVPRSPPVQEKGNKTLATATESKSTEARRQAISIVWHCHECGDPLSDDHPGPVGISRRDIDKIRLGQDDGSHREWKVFHAGCKPRGWSRSYKAFGWHWIRTREQVDRLTIQLFRSQARNWLGHTNWAEFTAQAEQAGLQNEGVAA